MSVLALLLGLALQEERVRDLVEKLSGDAIDVREEAAAALGALGADAVPLLEKLGATGDAERRGRIAEIVREIGREAVLRRTWRPAKRFDPAWRDVPLSRALQDLASATGEDLSGADALAGTVTLEMKRTTVWEALDALARREPGFSWAIDNDGIAVKAGRQPPFPLKAVDELVVWLDGVDYAQDVDFSGVPRAWATAGLNVAWTRGLAPAGVDVRVTEVLDKAGRNLLPPAMFRAGLLPRAVEPQARRRREEARVSLLGGATVDRVRGHAVLTFPRGFEDVKVPFGSGETVKAGDVQVTVRGGTSTKTSCSFQVMVTYPAGAKAGRQPPAEAAMIDDAGGEQKATARGQSMSSSGATTSMHYNFEAPVPADRRPASIRLRLLTDVFERRIEFDFENLPAP